MIKELLQWQTLSNQQLANIVSYETEYCFQKKLEKVKECLDCSRECRRNS
jgi:hypothetical protein